MQRIKRRRVRQMLCVLCLVSLMAAGCSGTPESAPTPTALPAVTVNPNVSEAFRRMEEGLLNGASNALRLESLALSQNSAIASVRIPDQLLNQFLDALSDETAWTHAGGQYTLTTSSGGDFVYEKPYSELITGSSTDVYTIEDETGLVEEIVDNTRFDPFTWVMSGEGGGEFAYMSVYTLADTGESGTLETVSRLNGELSGWSSDRFVTTGGRYRFADVQLSLSEDGTIAAPYQWVLCVGDIGAEDARIEEYALETDELTLPVQALSLEGGAEALFSQAARAGRRRSLFSWNGTEIQYSEND